MAKRVSVAELQAMSRGNSIDDTEIIDPTTDDAAATEALRRIGAPVNGNGTTILEGEAFAIVDDVLATGQATLQPDAMTRLVARKMPLLDVGAACSEEMTLGMVIDRVRDAVVATDWGKLATDAEIVAEAERIWGSFSVNRKGPREYTVVDGEVRDWRRPDTTPDRGDVTATHTLTDDEPRFSGGGDGQADERDLYAVPTDQQFNGKLYRDAPDLANIAEKLIGEHGHLEGLINCEIRYWWKRKVGAPKGRKPIGATKRTGDLLGHVLGSDFAIWLAADTAREAKFTPKQVEWAVFRQLCRIGTDENGNFISVPPDFEAFAAEIRVYGAPIENLRIARQAFQAGEQMGLFDADASPEDDDEIEAMERHELEDAPADPDGDSPEDEDVLADPAVI